MRPGGVRPIIYIAGPYSSDPVHGTRAAILAADAVWDAGGCPLVPHLSLLADIVSPRPYEEWLQRDLGLLAVCEAVIRLPGESAGADAEVEWALARNRTVVHVHGMDGEGMTVEQAARIAVLVIVGEPM
jgi:hypothetical protein